LYGLAFGRPAPGDPPTFSVDRLLGFFQVAEAQGVEFEVTMGKVKEVLAKSDKPERRLQAAHWKLLKATTPQDGILTYFAPEVARLLRKG